MGRAPVVGTTALAEELASDEVPGLAGGRPKKIDIDKMHAYRDSIRDLNDHRVVDYAAILYPGTTVTYGVDVAALQALPTSPGILDDTLNDVIRRRPTPQTAQDPLDPVVTGPQVEQTGPAGTNRPVLNRIS